MFEIITIDELLRRLNKYNHKELHIHHTWAPSHKDFNGNNAMQLQQGMKDYHIRLGWGDIGQHVTLLPNGLFVTGRDFGKTPASIKGYNTGSFACEMLGNFDNGNDAFQGEQKASALKLARYFDEKGKYVRFHRENSSKTCPGTSIDKDQFMSEVRGKIIEVKGVSIMVLKRGMTGAEVKKLQEKLNKLGFSLSTDGSFGPATESEVRAFQSKYSLQVDGIAGPATQAKIAELLAPNVEPAADYKALYNQKVLELNLAKSEIQELKNKLNQINSISRV